MALSGQQYVITAGEHEAVIVEVGAGLRSYRAGDIEIVPHYGDDGLAPRGAGSTLVPWPNRLRDGTYTFEGATLQLPLTEPAKHNSSHGLGRWVRWQAVAHESASVTMALDIVPQTGWPFEVRVEVAYSLSEERGLTVAASALNHGRGRVPFGAGFHPYLATRGHALDEVSLLLPATQRLMLDDASIPVGTVAVDGTPYDFTAVRPLGTLRMDDGFTGLQVSAAPDAGGPDGGGPDAGGPDGGGLGAGGLGAERDGVGGVGAVELHTPSGGTRLWFESAYRYLQVFTVDALVDGRPAIAVEPMTCAADAFNSGAGLVVLDPGGSWSGAWGINPL